MTVSEDAGCYNADKVVDMGSRCDEALAAKNLFAALRSFDEDGIQYVYSESFPTDNAWPGGYEQAYKSSRTYNYQGLNGRRNCL